MLCKLSNGKVVLPLLCELESFLLFRRSHLRGPSRFRPVVERDWGVGGNGSVGCFGESGGITAVDMVLVGKFLDASGELLRFSVGC